MRSASYVFASLAFLLLFCMSNIATADGRRIDPVQPDTSSFEDTTPTPCGPCAQATCGGWTKVKCYKWKKGCCGKKRLVTYYKWVNNTSNDFGDFTDDPEPGTSSLPSVQPGDQSTGETPTAARGPKEKD